MRTKIRSRFFESISMKKSSTLNQQQKTISDTLMITVNESYGGIFFLDSPSGTGETFIDFSFGSRTKSNDAGYSII